MKKKKVAKDEATAPVDFVLPREIWVLVVAAGVDADGSVELAMELLPGCPRSWRCRRAREAGDARAGEFLYGTKSALSSRETTDNRSVQFSLTTGGCEPWSMQAYMTIRAVSRSLPI